MMQHRRAHKWYFVSHLQESDRRSNGMPFEIQVLNTAGQATACGYLGEKDSALEIDGQPVPSAVIGAARRQEIGNGDYVDESGMTVQPF
jgi:hypothetical protein